MIIRVIVHVDTLHRNDVESFYFHSCKYYTDAEKACEETDKVLNNHDLNGGRTLASSEDFLSLNNMLAERFDTPYNTEAYAIWEDITDSVTEEIARVIQSHDWAPGLLLKMAEDCGIDLEEIF